MLFRSPRHDRASAYARSGLFKGLGSFAELERRIEHLPTEKERGDAFEVFVEAYLSTDEMAQAEDVWVVGKVPGEIRRRLNLPSRDYGYDGVFRTKLGELVQYQAKFRSGRTSLPYAELATFFGISEKADCRVVLTNSIAMSAVAEARTSFQTTRGREAFDIGIFDEAHKTTGREGARYGFALKDENLPIRKRLFLTATPRHYDIRKRDRDGEFAVASMDDQAAYGRVAHRLTFAQAAEQRIIVPYKVVISVVDSDMIDNALLDQSEVAIKGDPVRAKWVAHQIALQRAVEEHDVKRIITFHSSIRAAAAFASDDSEGVGFHLPNFQRFHVSGVQPTAERDEHMREFARVQRGVITNARCLTEGVDVPSVDMVAFMNPRRSRVDIVQAVGRAMRTAGADKTCGYVLVPLFLEMRKGETLDEALERSDFDEIAQVLNAMRDNDDELRDLIQALSIDRGRIGGFDESRLRDKVEVLGPQIQLSELAASIRTRLVNGLSITWDVR